MISQPPFASTLRDPGVRQHMNALAQLAAQTGAASQRAVILKNALNGGEISPQLNARFDLPRYSQGCHTLLNMIPLSSGGITKRPGLLFVGNAGEEGASNITGRLLPWVYSASLAYMLLLQTASDGSTGTRIYYMNRNGTSLPVNSGVDMPYKGQDIFDVCCCQVGKVIYMAHPKYKPGKLIVEAEEPRAPFIAPPPTFKYEELEFKSLPASNGIESITWEGQPTPGAPMAPLYYVVCGVDKDTGEEYRPCPTPGSHVLVPPTSNGYHWVINIKPTANCEEHRIYKLHGGEYGFIGRLTKGETAFHDYNFSPDMTDTPPREQEFFAKEGDYPSIVFMHQQRLGWASTDNAPLTLWLSQTSNFENLCSKVPPLDDDGIEVTLASSQANRILWAMPDRTGLAIGTQGEEWYHTGADGSSALTPSSVSFQPQTGYGTRQGIAPLRAASSLLFVQSGGRLVRDLGYSFAADRYDAQDLTLLARHLFRFATVVDWCWQQDPACILWCVLSSGKLIGLTYMRDQEVCAWHRHDTAGDFLSCATLQDSAGRSRLWVVVRRIVPQPGGDTRIAHYIEIMDNVFQGQPASWDKGAPAQQPTFTDGQAHHSYQARCIPCLPEVGSATGSSALRVKKINAVKCRVIHSSPIKARIISQNAPPSAPLTLPIPTATSNATHQDYVEYADWNCPLGSGFREGSRLELICDGPNPITILGLSVACELATEAGNQV